MNFLKHQKIFFFIHFFLFCLLLFMYTLSNHIYSLHITFPRHFLLFSYVKHLNEIMIKNNLDDNSKFSSILLERLFNYLKITQK